MKINVNGTEVTIKWSNRALVNYENITGKSFTDCTTYNDVLVLFYSFILGSTKNTLELKWEDYNDWLDEDHEKALEERRPEAIVDFSEWWTGELERQNILSLELKAEGEEKKNLKDS